MCVELFALIGCPWYFNLITGPLLLINLKQYRDGDHKLYFIRAGDYKKHYSRIWMFCLLKTLLYMATFGVGLVMLIITGVEISDS